MAYDATDTTTPGFKSYAAAHEIDQHAPTPYAIEIWRNLSQRYRDKWHAAARAAREELAIENRALQNAVSGMASHLASVELDYTNADGVRGKRHVRPISVFYGTTAWHKEPGLLMPCWDLDRGAFRIYSLEPKHLHAWDGVEVVARPEDGRVAELKAEVAALRQELDHATSAYNSAVRGRQQFREAFRSLRDKIRFVQETLAQRGPDAPDLDKEAEVAEDAVKREEIIADISKHFAVKDALTVTLGAPDAMARLAASRWHATLGFTSFKWEGLTDRQKAAWGAVVDFVQKASPQTVKLRDQPIQTARATMRQIFESQRIARFRTHAGEWEGRVGGYTDLPCGDTEFRVILNKGQEVQLMRVRDLVLIQVM